MSTGKLKYFNLFNTKFLDVLLCRKHCISLLSSLDQHQKIKKGETKTKIVTCDTKYHSVILKYMLKPQIFKGFECHDT